MRRGCLVSFEGGEGAGKSTVLARVRARIEAAGLDVVQTREPGGTPIGESIRSILLDGGNTMLVDEAELLLMFASRAQLVRELIAPALERGAWVVCDRFTDSSFAYQGGGRGIDPGFIAELEARVVGIQPDLTLLLDVPVRQGRARIEARNQASDRIEVQQEAFFERVRRSYLERAASDPRRFRVLDASRNPDQVADAACAEVAHLLSAGSSLAAVSEP